MISRLNAESGANLDVLGGKAAGLVRLLSSGLDVPEAWVVPAPVSLDAAARERVMKTDLPTWWREATAEFPTSLWAVRSSAVAEDLAEASFAGVYQTILAIDSEDALIDAVRTCWAALETDRAHTYRASHAEVGAVEGGIALVLQRMVRSDVAGVMLTENPLRPFHDEIVIDAAYGLGEAVVSGRTDPDHIVLDRASGDVLTERVGAKEVEVLWEGGLSEREVSTERRGVRCLTDADLGLLFGLAGAVTEAIGPRRDLEWAIEDGRLYVLQDRPITGLPPREPTEVWTRRFGDEYLAEYVSPLGNDLMIPWITEQQMDEVAALQGRRNMIEMTKLRRYDGHMYLNGDYAVELARGVPAGDRGVLTAWFDPTFAARIDNAKYQPGILIKGMRAPAKDKGRGKIGDNPKALARHSAVIDEAIAPKIRQDYTSLSDEEWQRQLDEVCELGREHFRVIRWGMGQHAPIMHAALAKLARSWAGDETGENFQALISGLPGTRTAEINRDVFDLGALARTDVELRDLLRSDSTYDEVRDKTVESAFWPAFDAFLAQHGHRSSSREISAERWLEQPTLVLGLVRAQVMSEDSGASPVEFEERAAARRTEAEARVLKLAGKGPAGPIRKRILRKVLAISQEYTVYRENQRYHLDYLLCHIHLLMLEQGRRLVERGALRHDEDVFLLTGERFTGLTASTGPVDDPALLDEVEAARLHRETHSRKLPPTFLFDEVPTEGKAEEIGELPDGAKLGLAASAGTVTGIARAVPSLADLSTVRTGDILVASNIDPGWTSVFPIISGLVTETGGVLSHGAILAREYGIPTVTCLPDAMTLLATGTRVEVDGTRGVVRVLD